MNSVTSTHLVNQQKIRRQASSFFVLKDPLESLQKVDRFRVSVRMLLRNEKGQLAYLHMQGFDDYGQRNHYESIGGGIDQDEDVEMAMRRELREESGYLLDNAYYFASVVDEYARFNQVNLHHYFLVDGTKKEKPLFTEFEKRFKIDLIFKDPQTWLQVFHRPAFGVDALVHQREYLMIAYLLDQLETLPALLDDRKRVSEKGYPLSLKNPEWLDILLHHHHVLDRLKYLERILDEATIFPNSEWLMTLE